MDAHDAVEPGSETPLNADATGAHDLEAEIQDLAEQLEGLREVIGLQSEAVRRVTELRDLAANLRERAADTDYEPSARAVQDLLGSISRSLRVKGEAAKASARLQH